MRQHLIVSDAGPLIGLAIAGHVEILQTLFERILIPPSVLEELQLEASRPGSQVLSEAKRAGWLSTEAVPDSADMATLTELLDRGEAEAIVLARAKDATLLIDERKGRMVARSKGVTVIGTGGLLILAKRENAIPRIAPVLDELASHGYRLSEALRRELLALANET